MQTSTAKGSELNDWPHLKLSDKWIELLNNTRTHRSVDVNGINHKEKMKRYHRYLADHARCK